MKRKITNIALYVFFCILCGTGILIWMAPKGVDWFALGMHEDIWKAVHIGSGFAMFAALIIHLAINWKWIEKVAASNSRAFLACILIFGAILILVPALAPIITE